MKDEKVYWTTRDGGKIDVDEMTLNHLRNVLKMIIKQINTIPKTHSHNTNDAIEFTDKEIDNLLNKSLYKSENEENMWK